MNDPKQKAKNLWLRIFQRDKTLAAKQKTETTNEARNKRAFTVSLVVGIMAFLGAIGGFISNNGKELTFTDARLLDSVLATVCFTSAWLARKGKGSLGAGLILIVVYGLSLAVALTLSGVGATIGVFVVGITLAFTSAVMPDSTAKRVNIISLFVAGTLIGLDLFEPFSRPADPTPVVNTSLVGIFAVIFTFAIIRRFNTYNLRTKLIIAFAAVTVIPLIGIGLYDNLKLSDALSQRVQKELGHFANQAALQIDAFNENRLTSIDVDAKIPPFIQFLSLNPTQRVGSSQEIDARNALQVFANQDKKFIRAYMLLDKDGTIVLNTANAKEQSDGQRQFLKQVAIKQLIPAMNGPFIDQKSSKASIYFSAPVKNQNEKQLGTLVVEYDANVIQFLIENQTSQGDTNPILFHVVSENTFIYIVNTDNHELLYKSLHNFTSSQITDLQSKGLLLPKNPLAVDPEVEAGLNNLGKSAYFTSLSNNTSSPEKYINNGVILKSLPWIAFAQQSESAISKPAAQQNRITALIFLVLLGLITLAAFGFSQLLASPILSLAAVAQKIAAGDLSLQSDIESNDEIGTLARAFNEMTRQSRALIDSLEQRSKALATSSEVSRRISTILDQQELVTEVVKQVQSAFNYYHAHIYLLDENMQELIMAGGTGEAGKAMLARGHKIPVGKGLVGRAAQNNITVLVADVAEEPQWLPNPLLPDTKSEVAVPIAIAERVLGVLDVQHNVAGTLKQEDVDVLQSIANQVAFAVRNARSYSEVQAKADRESLITSIGQKIQGTITVESALQVAIREIGRALNGAKTQIVLNENSTADNIPQDDNTVVKL